MCLFGAYEIYKLRTKIVIHAAVKHNITNFVFVIVECSTYDNFNTIYHNWMNFYKKKH
jgi:hypothetical protein